MPIATESLPNANGVDGITRMADVVGLPPTVTPSAAVTIPDSQLSDERKRAVKAYKMLREQWGCDEPGHDLCLQGNHYITHIQLSQEQISIWIDEICRGQATCHHPPETFIIPDGSRPNRNLNFDWGASETNTDPEVEIGTGYFCGLALERVGSTILYCSKVSLLLAKLSLYGQIVNHWSIYGNTGRRYKRPSVQRLGIILQETADLMRPSYPLYIRKRASNVFGGRTWIPGGYREDDYIQIILEWLGHVFRRSGENHVSPEIMSALYRNLTSAPLHVHYNEVLSNFIVILARYLSSWEWDYDSLPWALTHIVFNLCCLRELSFQELNAVHDYLESWLQQQ
ncbi:hypothetical protein BU17DRAFT_99337 [Hysterangium stoloniferum]|nr:hypothetical protein BU17DRAFT_99337 [Hysterangium stoloniferum]